jgi:hypothetical protein
MIGELAAIHMGTSALMGYVVAFRNPKNPSTFLFAIFPALVFHASYNILSLSRNMVTNFIVGALLAALAVILLASIVDTNRKLAQE